MNQNPEEIKNTAKKYSKKLAKLGTELTEIQFSYKVQEKTSKEFWQKRITEFRKYNEKSSEYYHQIYSLMDLVNKDESQMFLLKIGKRRQLELALTEIMEKIKENPSIIDSKDKQQSQWSKEIKKQIREHSNRCLNYEKDMNSSFRGFYEKQLKEIIE